MSSEKILLKEFIINHSSDASRLLEQLKIEQVVSLLNSLSTELLVVIMQEMDTHQAVQCLEEMEISQTVKVFENLPTNIAATFLRRIQKEKQEAILKQIDIKISDSLARLLYYADDTVAALMDVQVPVLPEELNVKEAFDKVKKSKNNSYQYVYVLNKDRKLTGILKLEDLVISEPKEVISSLMEKDYPYLVAELDILKALDHPGWIDYTSLPVLDRSGIFLGALNYSVLQKTDIDKTNKIPKQAILASSALGELYRIGLSGLLYSTSIKNRENE